jgi:hypothetical protein
MQLSKATLELLRDEAYVILCRDTLQEGLRNAERDRTQLVSSRPPFGMLAAKKTRDAFDASLKTLDQTEAALRERLAHTTRYETWLHRCIRRELATYLEAVSPEYQQVTRILRLLDDWEFHVKRNLPDTLVAFAREMRGLRIASAGSGGGEQPGTHELALLREIALRVENLQDKLSRLTDHINACALSLGLVDVRVPSLPKFRRSAWVESLCSVPADQAMADVTRAEGELRGFVTNGIALLISRMQASRVACAQAHENFLQQYWDQLRAHAQAHWVEEREVDQVLEALSQRYDPDILRRQREVTHNPFSNER